MTRDGHTTFVIGGTDVRDAATARLVLGSEPSVLVELVLPPGGVTSGIRYYAASLDGSPKVLRVDILDAAGHLLRTQEIVD
jgi:hypothetical protein